MAYALVGFQSFYELWPPQNHFIHHKHSTIFFSVVFKLIQTDVNEVLNDLKLRDYNGSGSIINYSRFILLFKNMIISFRIRYVSLMNGTVLGGSPLMVEISF